MFEKIKALAPIIVHTGKDHLAEISIESYLNDVLWYDNRHTTTKEDLIRASEDFIDDFEDDVALSYYIDEYDKKLHFLFDSVSGPEAEELLGLVDLNVIELEELKDPSKTPDFSDFETMF
jgi:hypothetical protein